MSDSPDIVVAGHICLDIAPELTDCHADAGQLIQPGKLTLVGPAAISLGGCVANTGVALQKLGAHTRMIGKVGDDLLGQTLMLRLRDSSPRGSDSIVVSSGEATSYTVVISPPGLDRCFLHCSGVNDTFSAEEIELNKTQGARIFHFGYPPIMAEIRARGGAAFAARCKEIARAGTLVSMDMTMPDANAESGRADWQAWLQNVLPAVHLFMPSFDEILFMLEREEYESLKHQAGTENLAAIASPALLDRLADKLLGWGSQIVLIKLGDQGLYLRTATDLSAMGSTTLGREMTQEAWQGRQLLAPCFQTTMVNATGAGDSTIAGFLMAIHKQLPPESALRCATMVGAMSVRDADSLHHIAPFEKVLSDIEEDPAISSPAMQLSDWEFNQQTRVYHGPADSKK